MPWQVELPSAEGTSPQTVTVEGGSWKLALAAARDGRAVTKFRCEFDADGTMRVHDLVSNERFALRQIKPGLSIPPVSLAPPSVPPAEPVTAPALAPSTPDTAVVPETPVVLAVTMPSPVAASVVPPASVASAEPAPARVVVAVVDVPPEVVAAPVVATSAPVVAVAEARVVSADATAPVPVFELAREVSRPSFTPVRTEIAVPAPATLVYQRNREADATGGLTFRERILALPPGSSADEAERIARAVFDQLRASLDTAPAGKLVSIAVFDHGFRRRPERPPLLVLTWGDWRGEPVLDRSNEDLGPEITLVPRESSPRLPVAPAASVVEPAPMAASPAPVTVPETAPPVVAETAPPVVERPVPPPAVATVVAPAPPPAASEPIAVPAAAPIVVSPAPSIATTPVVPPAPAAPPTSVPHPAPAATMAPSATTSRPPAGRPSGDRRTSAPSWAKSSRPAGHAGEDLLAAAFDATQDLALLKDSEEACAFVARVTVGVLDAAAAIVTEYDIDRDELRLASAVGVLVTESRAAPLSQSARGEAALRNRVIALPALPSDDVIVPLVPAGPALYAPARHDRRLFAVVQIHREPGGRAFTSGEIHAVQYIATQLGEFLATHSRRVGFDDPAARSRSRQR